MFVHQVHITTASFEFSSKWLQDFVKFCDSEDQGLGWSGLEKARYLISQANKNATKCHLLAEWSISQNHKDLGLKIQSLMDVWKSQFEFVEVPLSAGVHADWRVIHTYHAGGRQDCRSPLMDEVTFGAFVREPQVFGEIRKNSKIEKLPPISVSAQDGQALMAILKIAGARRGVEIGTLGGYSAAWICEAIGPEGTLITIEKDPKRSRLAAEHLQRAGFQGRVECRGGDALVVLKNLEQEPLGWDFVFIDADKSGYGEYVEWAMRHLKVGGLILADNAYLWGGMLNYPHQDIQSDEAMASLKGVRRLHGYDTKEFMGMSQAWRMLSESDSFLTFMLPTPEGLLVAQKIK